ncbi:MAG: hypothetical protein ACRD6N_13380, partial [Pyrinomonadaceae bacterium]
TATFQKLRAIYAPYASKLKVVTDTNTNYYLDTHHIMKNKKPLFFGAVRIGKSYVSFHLMPVYAFPELLESASAELKKRMQGKSCFNFTSVDDELFKELAKLTRAGFAKYTDPKFIEKW